METRRGTRLRVVPDVFNNVPMDFLLRSRTKPIRCTPNAISPQNGHESTNVIIDHHVNHRAYVLSTSVPLSKKKRMFVGISRPVIRDQKPEKIGMDPTRGR